MVVVRVLIVHANIILRLRHVIIVMQGGLVLHVIAVFLNFMDPIVLHALFVVLMVAVMIHIMEVAIAFVYQMYKVLIVPHVHLNTMAVCVFHVVFVLMGTV
jgi:hypothetical protein